MEYLILKYFLIASILSYPTCNSIEVSYPRYGYLIFCGILDKILGYQVSKNSPVTLALDAVLILVLVAVITTISTAIIIAIILIIE